MSTVPASRVLSVIASCRTPEQVNVASLYALRWCQRTGHGPQSMAAKMLFHYAARKTFGLLRGPGGEVVKPPFQNQARKGHGGKHEAKPQDH